MSFREPPPPWVRVGSWSVMSLLVGLFVVALLLPKPPPPQPPDLVGLWRAIASALPALEVPSAHPSASAAESAAPSASAPASSRSSRPARGKGRP